MSNWRMLTPLDWVLFQECLLISPILCVRIVCTHHKQPEDDEQTKPEYVGASAHSRRLVSRIRLTLHAAHVGEVPFCQTIESAMTASLLHEAKHNNYNTSHQTQYRCFVSSARA